MGQLFLVLGPILFIIAGLNTFKMKDKRKILLLVMLLGAIMFSIGFYITPRVSQTKKNITIENKTKNSSSKGETSENKESIEKEQKELIVANSQLALKDYNIEDDTSPLIDKWNIAKDKDNWIATTSTPKHKRIKVIIKWTGSWKEESQLIYLLVDGNEYLNELNNK